MVLGLKTVVWCVSNYRTPSSGSGPRGSQTGAAIPLTEHEIELIATPASQQRWIQHKIAERQHIQGIYNRCAIAMLTEEPRRHKKLYPKHANQHTTKPYNYFAYVLLHSNHPHHALCKVVSDEMSELNDTLQQYAS